MKALSQDANGLLSLRAYAGGEMNTPTHQPTISGPGWSSLLTGVWIDRYGAEVSEAKRAAADEIGVLRITGLAELPAALCL